MALADCLEGVGFTYAGVQRLYLTYQGRLGDVVTMLQCWLVPPNQLWTWMDTAQSMMLLVLSVDRLLAVTWPLWYMHQGVKYAYVMCALAYSHGFVEWIVSWVLAVLDGGRTPAKSVCKTYMSQYTDLNVYHTCFYTVTAFLSCIVYGLVLLVNMQRSKVLAGLSDSQNVRCDHRDSDTATG